MVKKKNCNTTDYKPREIEIGIMSNSEEEDEKVWYKCRVTKTSKRTSQLFQYVVRDEWKDILDQYKESSLLSKHFSEHIYKADKNTP